MKGSPRSDQHAGVPLRGGIPLYHPSTVTSRTGDFHAILSSPHPAGIVEHFYAKVLAHGGWRVVSHASGPGRATFSARRDGFGATIAIYHNLNATGISISTYRV